MQKATGTLAIILLSPIAQPAEAAPLSLPEFDQLARECAPSVAPSTLAAIAKVESQFDPLSVHDNTTGETLHWRDQMGAAEGVKHRLQAGHSVDVGLMQVNSKNFTMLGLTPYGAIRPCASLSAASRLLENGYKDGPTAREDQLALRRAISVYNTGNFGRGFTNGYVRKVELAAQQLVPALTDNSKDPDRATSVPQTSWDIWGTYDRRRSAGGVGGSSGPPEPREPVEQNNQHEWNGEGTPR
ncbi:type IV secretion system lytic transglycosylase VirB1 (plasmid) [Agrobacterium leguminum]|uniref:Protein virB1 n=1 Tax=Agrobacterium deltaense NCPPB 1641 TaxID=1183425 RepID=A0A1S7UBG0_9HYPH|nr:MULTISPECIES: type IV secretion system lytic transglycosylase VirB1 [Agrobacterium]WFS69658.1 type IV secretion system lytic transglycosylase VirB1 [Agrobacterium leguminum]CVI63708.1 Protein virB1 [Agrobacterium deltaense NCPPB 1641]